MGVAAIWIFYAVLSALFAGLMSVLAKVGIRSTDSSLATALRSVVVLVFAWIMVLVAGSQVGIRTIDTKSLVFLVLSGLATGGSWLCYFRALQLGDINKVVPVDKSSSVITLLLSMVLLGEGVTLPKVAAMVLIGAGTYMMIPHRESAAPAPDGHRWLPYAMGAAIFASLTTILGKIGIAGVESNLGTAIRTIVVVAMAWLMVFIQGGQREIRRIDRRSWVFILLSGIATGLSWLCYYRALQEGPASVVSAIDKLSILITVAFGYFVFSEKLTRRATLGLASIVAGTLGLVFFGR